MAEALQGWAFNIGLFAVGLVLLERGADIFIDEISDISRRTGQSETLIGLLTAGMEWEELLVAVVAVLTGHTGIALGDLIGSNIANVTGSFSLGPLVRPLQTNRDDRRYGLLMLGITGMVCALLVTTREVSRPAGGGLVLVFLAYVGLLLFAVRRGVLNIAFPGEEEDDDGGGEGEEGGEGTEANDIPSRDRPLWKEFGEALAGLALIVAGAAAVVEGAVFLARALQVPEVVIGVTLVAVGTTLPDKVISIAGALKGRHGVVTANAIGSNIFNLTFALGLAALVQPIQIGESTLRFDVPALLGCTVLLTVMLFQRHIPRWQGAVLLVLYAAYLAAAFLLH